MLQISWKALSVLLTVMGMISCASVWIINLRLRSLENHVRVILAEERAQLLKEINGAYLRRELFESHIEPIEASVERLQEGQIRLWGRLDELPRA